MCYNNKKYTIGVLYTFWEVRNTVQHEEKMRLALKLAEKAASESEVPVGCVITDKDGNLIGSGRNRRESEKSALAHAEIEAIAEACKKLGNWRLDGCTMYVTLEPCPMCAGAILNARISELRFGARDAVSGSCGSVINLFMENYGFSPKIIGGLLEHECSKLLTDFFKKLRYSSESIDRKGAEVV